MTYHGFEDVMYSFDITVSYDGTDVVVTNDFVNVDRPFDKSFSHVGTVPIARGNVFKLNKKVLEKYSEDKQVIIKQAFIDLASTVPKLRELL